MAQRLRWGILGTGNIAWQFATGVRASRRGTLAAVGSRRRDSAEKFAREFSIPRAFGTYEQLLSAPDIDVIYVSLPNSLHLQWTLAALRAGKHVLCEKPLGSDAEEAQQMFDAAQSANRLLMEAFMYRSHPQTLAVIEAVRAGAIGELKLIRTSFCYRTQRIAENIRFNRELAGGGVMDVGCYCTNFARLFAGTEPTAIHATGHLHESGVDDLAAGTLTFPVDILSTFTCGMTVQADNTAYLCGSDGFIEIPVPWKPPPRGAGFTIVRATPPRMDAAGQPVPATPPRQPHVIDAGSDLYAIEADDFAASVLDGQPLRITPEDSLGNMRVLDEIRRQLGVVW